ncbi:EF-hand domain [Trinorchestia longiramus]|nr:EF-hand domain [Trinorchestia longiramus]
MEGSGAVPASWQYYTVTRLPEGRSTDANSLQEDDGGRAEEGPKYEDKQTRDHVERLFKKLDLNGDGVITIDEFVQSCLQVRTLVFTVLPAVTCTPPLYSWRVAGPATSNNKNLISFTRLQKN